MPVSRKIPLIACVAAFAMALLTAAGALMGPIVILPAALIPLFAGIGIIRRRVWSAYGFAVYLLAQLLILPVILLRPGGNPGAETSASLVSAAFQLLLTILFVAAGRSLASGGATRGKAWPWILVAAMSTLPLLFVQAFFIPTGAMEDTLLPGDRILVQSFPSSAPARGDMVTFIYPIDRKQTFVKRVIGIPGDRIRISRKIVYRNGSRLDEPYAVHKMDYEDLYRDDFPSEPNAPVFPQAQEMLSKHVVNGEVVVPSGEYFVLGDNRDQSLDSRYWGFVSAGDLIGRPLLIYDSEVPAGLPAPKIELFKPRHTRWERIFRLL